MSHAYHRLHYHLVFSTKNRLRTITSEIKPRLYPYMIGIAQSLECICESIGGVEDHIHLLVHVPPKLAVSDFIEKLKSNSSKWVHNTFIGSHHFGWQRGYGLFTVSESGAAAVAKYIDDQVEHHRTMTFEQEFIALLEKHGLSYDPKYVFE